MKARYFLICIIAFVACKKNSDPEVFYMPGEFEPHEAVWLGWEESDTTMHRVVFDMIHGLSGIVQVKIAVDSDSLKAVAKAKLHDAGIRYHGYVLYCIGG